VIKISKFYISDLHFGHQKCIDFDSRPFKSLDDMHETMIQNWNSVVSKGDLVYVLGDMF
jgi:calcineurin-like phosphoesterase family protein